VVLVQKEEKMSESKFDVLPDEMKLIALEWMRDGLIGQTATAVSNHARVAFHRALKGETFDPKKIWEGVPQRSIDHLDHVAPHVVLLNDMIAEIAGRLMPKTKLPAEPELTPSTPKPAKKKIRGKRPGRGCR
jgi:hypothetical protein